MIGVAIALYSRKYGLGTLSSPGAGFLPFLSGLAMAVLAVVVFVQRIPGKKDTLVGLWANRRWPAVPIVLAALVAYAVVLNTLGFVLDTFFLTAFLLRVMQPLAWKKVLAGAAGATLGSYAVFRLWLEAQLPVGFLGF